VRRVSRCEHKARTRPASSSGVTVSILAGPSRWGQAPGRSAAHGRLLAGPVDPVRIPPLALDPYLVEQRYHRQHLRIFGVSNFVILDACLTPDLCWGALAGLCECLWLCWHIRHTSDMHVLRPKSSSSL
jgi:hypothetical protein